MVSFSQSDDIAAAGPPRHPGRPSAREGHVAARLVQLLSNLAARLAAADHQHLSPAEVPRDCGNPRRRSPARRAGAWRHHRGGAGAGRRPSTRQPSGPACRPLSCGEGNAASIPAPVRRRRLPRGRALRSPLHSVPGTRRSRHATRSPRDPRLRSSGSRQAHRPIRCHKAEAVPAIAPATDQPVARSRTTWSTSCSDNSWLTARPAWPAPITTTGESDAAADARSAGVYLDEVISFPPRPHSEGTDLQSLGFLAGDKCKKEPELVGGARCGNDRKSVRTGVPQVQHLH